MSIPRLYDELAWLWPIFSPAEDYAEEAATFRRRFQRLGVRDGGSVLHLGCGGGSLDAQLKQHYRVAGIDLSGAMLKQAALINPECIYVPGDMRTVRLNRRFDAVLVHDAISYMTTLEDLLAVFRTAAEHLDRGGVMLVVPEEIRSRLPLQASVTTVERQGIRLDVMETYHDADPDDRVFEEIFVFLIRRGDEEPRVVVDRHTVGVHELHEYLDAVRKAGFSVEAERWELAEWGDGPELPLLVAVRQ
jgi:SAM-dependent methyltransferase